MKWEELESKSRSQSLGDKLKLPEAFTANWITTDADRKLAWELYSDLRTRITTQPLHYTHGDEVTALKSLVDVFKLAREKVRLHGPEARACSTLVVFVLYTVIRPFTAEWHKKSLAGELNREDGRRLFRTKFEKLQVLLRQFASMLAVVAEQDAFCERTESWPPDADTKATDTKAASNSTAVPEPIPLSLLFNIKVNSTQRAALEDWDHSQC